MSATLTVIHQTGRSVYLRSLEIPNQDNSLIPKLGVSLALNLRAMMSVEAPAANGTNKRMGLSENFSCAFAERIFMFDAITKAAITPILLRVDKLTLSIVATPIRLYRSLFCEPLGIGIYTGWSSLSVS
jgi:hypothetical protein